MEEISPGAGFQCLSLMLFQILLSGKEGYDARVRYPVKRLGVTIFIHNNTSNTTSGDDYGDRPTQATRKFESLERMIADRILGLASKQASSSSSDQENSSSKQGGGPSQRDIVRGLKIGTAGVLAGTLLVVTGGMAAPGIVAGLGALGLASVGATFLALAGSTVVISIFVLRAGVLPCTK